jgi:hypothetical protein
VQGSRWGGERRWGGGEVKGRGGEEKGRKERKKRHKRFDVPSPSIYCCMSPLLLPTKLLKEVMNTTDIWSFPPILSLSLSLSP